MKRLTLFACVIALLSGCEYKERETFVIQTVDGKKIQLTCPVVSSKRSESTYIIDGHCVIEPYK